MNHAGIMQVSVPEGTTTKKTCTVKPGKEDSGGEVNNTETKDTFDDKRTAKLPSRWKEEVPFEKAVSSQEVRNKKIGRDYGDKKLDLQLKSLPTYLQECMIQKDHLAKCFRLLLT